MKTLLAIESSTERCSVALMHAGQVHEKMIEGTKRHAESVLVFIDALLHEHGVAKHQLQGVAFGRGPGAFTGVRLAVALAQGFAFGLDIPALPVSTLAATAFDAFDRHPELRTGTVLVALDARMGEVYLGRYRFDDGQVREVEDERLCKPDAVGANSAFCIGSGVRAYREFFLSASTLVMASTDDFGPRASAIAKLALGVQAVSAEQALPVYLRDHVALSIRERLAAGMQVMQPL